MGLRLTLVGENLNIVPPAKYLILFCVIITQGWWKIHDCISYYSSQVTFQYGDMGWHGKS
jgi:hypothetical protein